MEKLTFSQIKKLQKTYGVDTIQETINSGLCWKMEGSSSRFAMQCLEAGMCMLPLEPKYDYYGTLVPARSMLKQGSKGTFLNSVNFWIMVYDGDYDTIECLEETFWVS